MPISSVHPEYEQKIRRVRFVRDMCSDEMTVKDKCERYLPAAFAKEEPERYEAYLKRAYFFGVTNKTLRDNWCTVGNWFFFIYNPFYLHFDAFTFDTIV